jgi:hypothetical protein
MTICVWRPLNHRRPVQITERRLWLAPRGIRVLLNSLPRRAASHRATTMRCPARHLWRSVAVETCAGSHHWAREISKLGHTVRLIPPGYVKPFTKRQKSDEANAEVICEAVKPPSMRFVPVKDEAKQANGVVFRAGTFCSISVRSASMRYVGTFPNTATSFPRSSRTLQS